jgi:ABC-2 type transport system permease protein
MFGDVLRTEFLKLRHSRVPWITLAIFGLGPLGLALFMWIAADPARAKSLGLIGTKASLLGLAPTWPAFLTMFTEVIGGGGLLLLAFVIAYLFGREFQDGTAKNMLTLPAGRHLFVLAKFAVAAVWWVVIVAVVTLEVVAIGSSLSLAAFTYSVASAALARTVVMGGTAFLLSSLVGFVAVLGRGYLAPLGYAVGTLALGDTFAHTGWAAWFPWSIESLLSGTLGRSGTTLPAGSLVVLLITFLVGVLATMAQLRWDDNTQ